MKLQAGVFLCLGSLCVPSLVPAETRSSARSSQSGVAPSAILIDPRQRAHGVITHGFSFAATGNQCVPATFRAILEGSRGKASREARSSDPVGPPSDPAEPTRLGGAGFPADAHSGLYVKTIGQSADVYLVPSDSPDAQNYKSAVSERYRRGTTPLYIRSIPPGKYRVWLRLSRPMLPPGGDGWPLLWSDTPAIHYEEGRIVAAWSQDIVIEADKLGVYFANLLPRTTSYADMEALYDAEAQFSVNEKSVHDVLVKNYAVPEESIPVIVRLLRRGGAVTIRPKLFVHMLPGRDSFSIISVGANLNSTDFQQKKPVSSAGFPDKAAHGLFVTSPGRDAEVYIVPADSPDAESVRALSGKYHRGRTPLYLPDLAPGDYVVWFCPVPAIAAPEGPSHEILIASGNGCGGLWPTETATGKRIVAAFKKATVKAGTLTSCSRILLLAGTSLAEMDRLYPPEGSYPVPASMEKSLSHIRPIPQSEYTRIISLLRRGGAVSLHGVDLVLETSIGEEHCTDIFIEVSPDGKVMMTISISKEGVPVDAARLASIAARH